MMNGTRTIISALHPRRYQDSFTEIFMTVWFEELNAPVAFLASPLDSERHGKELWIRAMAGEYGPIEVIPENFPLPKLPVPMVEVVEPPKLLEYHGS